MALRQGQAITVSWAGPKPQNRWGAKGPRQKGGVGQRKSVGWWFHLFDLWESLQETMEIMVQPNRRGFSKCPLNLNVSMAWESQCSFHFRMENYDTTALNSARAFWDMYDYESNLGPYSKNIYCNNNRRKFRSQTSDNMDRWKAEQGRGREKRKIRRKKSRRERVRRKKMQMREKVGKSQNTV